MPSLYEKRPLPSSGTVIGWYDDDDDESEISLSLYQSLRRRIITKPPKRKEILLCTTPTAGSKTFITYKLKPTTYIHLRDYIEIGAQVLEINVYEHSDTPGHAIPSKIDS